MKKLTRYLVFLLSMVLVLSYIPCNVAAETITSTNDLKLLGKGFNLLGEQSLSNANLKSQIFISMHNISSAEYTGASTTNTTFTYISDMTTYLENEKEKWQLSMDANARFKVVALDIKSKFAMETQSQSFGSTNNEFAIIQVSATRANYKLNINTEKQIQRLWETDAKGNYLTLNPDFVEALKTAAPEELFAQYGTHIVTAYDAGGEAYASYQGSNLKATTSSSNSWNANVSGQLNTNVVLEAKAGFDAAVEESSENGNENIVKQTSSKVTGGNGASISIETLIKGDSDVVNNWLSTLQKDNNLEILNDDNLRLLPVWELLVDDMDYDRKVELEEYFTNNVNDDYVDFYRDYIYNPSNSGADDFSDYTIINTAEDLNNIRNNLSGKYVLGCNIDLNNVEWEPIGTSVEPFSGILNGNGNTISNLKISKCTQEGVAGLFGYSNGIIKNLHIDGNIEIDASNTPNDRALIGALVGYNSGIVYQCQNSVSINGKMTMALVGESVIAQSAAEGVKIDDVYLADPVIYNLNDITEPIDIVMGGVFCIKIIGSPETTYSNINITIQDRSYPAYIILENAHIVGSSENGTIFNLNDNGRDVYIISEGTSNSIIGKTNAINVTNANLFITGNAEMLLRGGDGETGLEGTIGNNGTNGMNGYSGVNASNVIVDSQSTIKIFGGNGGIGGVGGAGSGGWNGVYGTNAGSGGNGGDGGAAITITDDGEVCVINGELIAVAGNGGTGGNGGIGGAGGDTYEWASYAGCGSNGGNGGNGGNSTIAIFGNTRAWNAGTIVELLSKGGNGGNGGAGGKGGNGVPRSACDTWFCYGSYPPGINGQTGGNGGNGGNGGTGSTVGSAGACGNAGAGGAKGWSNYRYATSWLGDKYRIEEGSAGQQGAYGTVGTNGSECDIPVVRCSIANKQYLLYNNKVSWNDAKNNHVESLCSIDSVEERILLESLIDQANGENYWIGLHCKNADTNSGDDINRWVWENGKEIFIPDQVECVLSNGKYIYGYIYDTNDQIVGYANWLEGEPNNSNGDDFYVYISAEDKYWRDSPNAGIDGCGYIIEKDIVPNSTNDWSLNTLSIGGICGYNIGTVEWCYNNASMQSEAFSREGGATAVAGGIVGLNNYIVKNCHNSGTITAFSKTESDDYFADAYAQNIAVNIKIGEIVECTGAIIPTADAESPNLYITEFDTVNDCADNVNITTQIVEYWNNPIVIQSNSKSQYVCGSGLDKATISITDTDGNIIPCTFRYYFYQEGITCIVVKYQNFVRYIPVEILPVQPTEIKINHYPRTEYVVGDVFSTDGLIIDIVYNNDTIKRVTSDNEKVTIVSPNMATDGQKEISVTYLVDEETLETLSCAYNISVVPLQVSNITIKALPHIVEYHPGETLNVEGLLVEKTYNNGKTEIVSLNDELLSISYDFTTIGAKDVTVTFGDVTTTFVCIVKHSTVYVPENTSSCLTSGTKEHYMCTLCDLLFIDENATISISSTDLNMDISDHVYGKWIEEVAPTCEGTGICGHYQCSVCSKYFNINKQEINSIIIDASGHIHAEAVEENKVDSTCTTNGSYDSVVYCSVCSAELSRDQKTIDKLGHDHSPEWTVDIEPTCITVGSKSHHCTRCENKSDITEVEVLGHSFTDYKSNNDATYTENGTETAKCNRCTVTDTRTDEDSALGLDQKFKDEMTALSKNADVETTYAELYSVLQTYATLSDAEKMNVTAEYATLQQLIENYNAKVQVANTELADATEIAFAPIAINGFTFIAALWVLLKKKFFI